MAQTCSKIDWLFGNLLKRSKSAQNFRSIRAVPEKDLPPEFKKHEKPFGLEQHQWNIISCGVTAHVGAFYYFLCLLPLGLVPRWSFALGSLYAILGGLGTTVGSHRYWTHRTFKAKLPLQVMLMLMQTITFSYPIFKWCRDHRVHHKYTDTDADPHNSKRGFWFCHIGWLFEPKHPQVVEKLQSVDISDLANDPVVRFQSKYFLWLVLFMCIIFPSSLCLYFFPEITLLQLFAWNMSWYASQLHASFLVNSVAHLWKDKPYDKHISASECGWVSFFAVGEGWHNYHHTFPWDYKAAEFGWKLNLSTMFIDFFAWLGLAYDLKTVSHKLLLDRIRRTGDGSHPLVQTQENTIPNCLKCSKNSAEIKEEDDLLSSSLCWGWGDIKLKQEDVQITENLFPRKLSRNLFQDKLSMYRKRRSIL